MLKHCDAANLHPGSFTSTISNMMKVSNTVSENTVSVFRVEDESGEGPYGTNQWVAGALMNAHNDTTKHPNPYHDTGLYGINHGEYCAFSSREELDKWFYGFKKHLKEAGFRIAEYLVPEYKIRRGAKQVVFLREDLKPVRVSPCLR